MLSETNVAPLPALSMWNLIKELLVDQTAPLHAYLIDVMVSNDVIEASVEVIEEVNNLDGSAHRRQVGELNDVREVDGGRIEDFRLDCFTQFQLFSYHSENSTNTKSSQYTCRKTTFTKAASHLRGQHSMKKLVGFLFFQHQFLCALVHDVLEVVGVTLELLNHRVHYVDLPDINERAELKY